MTRIVSTPHLGKYYICARPIGRLFGDTFIEPPAITKRTLEIGAKYSPEAACVPFKYTLGNFIEVLEQGANVLVQIGGGCRLGFYGEVQKAILHKLGYEFEFIKLVNNNNVFAVIRNVKQVNPSLSYMEIIRTFWLAYKKADTLDTIEDFIRKNVGFEVKEGSFERVFKRFLTALDRAATPAEVLELRTNTLEKLANIEINKPEKPIRVGLVGEVYVVMEPFSNFFMEKELAHYGIEVHRFVTVTEMLHEYLNRKKHMKEMQVMGHPYVHKNIGGHGMESVARAVQLSDQGFDGLIHVKPFGCMPEINAMPILQKISRDRKFPIIYFSFDSLTSETGIKTRLEAFYDMLVMRGESWKPSLELT